MVAEGELHTDPLEVDDHEEDEDRRQERGHIRKILPCERFLQSTSFVRASDEEMHQSNQTPFELCPAPIIVSVG